MGFNAATEIDVLDYDFTHFVPDCRGVTPEPSKDTVLAYQRAMREAVAPAAQKAAAQEASGEVDERSLTAADLNRYLEQAEENEQLGEEILEAIIEATGAVGSNKPSADEIRKLPWRVQQHYIGYIAGKFLQGEALTPATKQ